MQNIFPFLKDSGWPPPRDCPAFPLIAVAVPHVPWVTFAVELASHFRVLSTSDIKGSLEQTRGLAFANLERRRIDWRLASLRVAPDHDLQMLVADGDSLANEAILRPQLLRRAAQLLGARALLVGVPSRGAIFAIPAYSGPDNDVPFGTFISEQYYLAQTPPISPLLFVVEDGAICGHVDAFSQSAQSTPAKAVHTVAQVHDTDDTFTVACIIVSAQPASFEPKVLELLTEQIKKHADNSAFREIRFCLTPFQGSPTPDELRCVAEALDRRVQQLLTGLIDDSIVRRDFRTRVFSAEDHDHSDPDLHR